MASANHGRDVVALVAAERQTAELFEPNGRVFGCRGARLSTTVADIELKTCPGATDTFQLILKILDSRIREE